MSRVRKWTQETIEFRKKPGKRGGRRVGAGRKRGPNANVPHRARPKLNGRTPVHVTLRLLPDVMRLRRLHQYKVVRQALTRTAHRADCAITHYSVQDHHVHLICEPRSVDAMASGMTAFKTSCARRLNGLVARSGSVFDGRYHAVYLHTPAQVRNAIAYVLNNWLHHGEDRLSLADLDPFSSAELFDGYLGRRPRRPPWLGPDDIPPVARPTSWLLREGWRRHGLIHPRELPGRR